MLLLLAVTTTGRAQKAFIFNCQQKNGFISLSMGVSKPLGTFGKRTSETDENGLALMGQTVSLSGGYRLAGPLGIMARYDQTEHGVYTQALLSQFSQQPGGNLTATAAEGRAGRWQSRTVMAGPYVTIPLGRFVLDIRALAGQAWTTCPQTWVQTLNQTETLFCSDNRVAKAIASGLGLSLRYRLSPTVGAHVSTDYTSARFTFANVPVESHYGRLAQQFNFAGQKTLTTATLSAGVTVQFRSRNRVF